uniref:LIM domain only protein 7 isoform X4 n=1 Tax=Monopterus albus TaxID=43700 RepID=UPI0009B3806A|nr:LIM domain only protein 7 isoform X4 [Monopterus albus]
MRVIIGADLVPRCSSEKLSVMEWREQSSVSCDEAYVEAQRWIEAVTKKKFGSNDFRSALENGVLLCDLINNIKRGIIKRVNRLPTPIAGLDNLNVFLKACGKLGLKEAQLFHPGDLQDLTTRVTVKHQETNRRLKNVLITIYWLGRRAQCDQFYDGPHLNFKPFEGLLGTALYKALQESSSQKGSSVRDSGFGDSWYSEREELYPLRGERRGGGGGGSRHRRDDSLDSLDSLGSRPHSISSDATLKGSSEGCCSDTEADSAIRMADNKDPLSYRRSAVVTPKASAQFNQFLPTKDKPSGYVPAPLRKKRAERDEESRRSWANSTSTEEEVTLTRSKSTDDILTDPAVVQQIRYKELQKYRERIKENEDKWQDDLSKWKNRRRSVNSDIVKKKEEREKIEQITYGSKRKSKTFKEMEEDRENKGGGTLPSLSYLDDSDDVFEKPTIAPRSRTLPARSYTIDTPYRSSGHPEPSLKEVDPPAASPATGNAASPPTYQEADIMDSPTSTDFTPTLIPSSRSSVHSYQPPAAAPLQRSPVLKHSSTAKTEENTNITSSSLQKVPEPRRPLSGAQAEVEAPFPGSLYKKQPQSSSMEPKPPGVSKVTASLPRSYQRSDNTRLTSVVTPRPFGTQPSSITSLPRASAHKRVNGDVTVSKNSSVPSRYHAFMTSEDEAQSSSAHSSEQEDEVDEPAAKSITSTQSISPVPPLVKSEALVSSAPAKVTSQENYCEMRINLNQKPNSSRDFGFQAAWDSTGARVTSIQPGSSAEMCQLQPGDKVLTVNGHKVAEMSYTDWKSLMEEALQEGSLVMDVRRHGKNNWDRNQPSLPFKTHKTINLTTTDHPILLGTSGTNVGTSSLDFSSHISAEKLPSKEAPPQPAVDVASNRVNGGFFQESVTMRSTESEPISMKNLKRRSEFFEKGSSGSSVNALVYLCGKRGGSESAMPDIPVPSITSSSSHWSWDPEEERKRQEKWLKEQERLLQEKYKRDQEKLQQEWLKAQQEIAKNMEAEERKKKEEQERQRQVEERRKREEEERELQRLQEERKRQEEQERQRQVEERRKREEKERELQRLQEERKRQEEQERQRQVEERRKREEKERELQRLQEERKRKERQEEDERKRREQEQLRLQMRREEEEEEERRWQEVAEQQRRERARSLEQQQQQQQWADGFHYFDSVQPPLSFTDRVKSKSSPQLDEEEKPQRKDVFVQPGGLAQWLLEEQLKSARDKQAQSQKAASELEMERRNILNAMRYRQPERVTGVGVGENTGQQPMSKAELERQQILNEMKKKTSLLRDGSWIRQRASNTATHKENDVPPMRRGESLDNLDSSYNSWRSSWTSRNNSYVQNYARPHSALSGSTSFYSGGSGVQRPGSSALPSSSSMGSLQGGAGTPSFPWSQQTSSPSLSSLSPTTSPEPMSEAGGPQQRSRSVSGKKNCTFCDTALGKGAAMIIESLGLCYHLSCFKCTNCKADLGGSEAGAEVRIRNKMLYCNSCYVRFKTGHPTAM